MVCNRHKFNFWWIFRQWRRGWRPGEKWRKYLDQRVQELESCSQEIQSSVQRFQREMERTIKQGFCEDGEMAFEEYSLRWLDRQVKYAAGTIASYRRMLKVTYPFI